MRSLGRLVLACSAGLLVGACSPPSQRTNVVLIVVDDLGWSDLGVYGNRFHETPEIDALAREGVRFTDFYAAAPVCSPTRASILTGQHPARLGMTDFTPGLWRPFERLVVPPASWELPDDVPTLGELFRQARYRTAFFGKWHAGREASPGDRGFRSWLMTAGEHVAPGIKTRPRTKLPAGTHLTDYLTDRTLEFVEQHRTEPFFVVLSHLAVHMPLQAKPEAIAYFEGKQRPSGSAGNARYAAMLGQVDESVGRVRAELERLGLADRTAVLLTSDNGAVLDHFLGVGDPIATNDPLRSGKGTLYEGGIRVPLIVRWPGRASAGGVVAEPAITMDLLPTLLEIAGIATPGDATVDGTSLVPLLEDPSAGLERDSLHFHYPHYHHSRPAGAVRVGTLKLIEFFDDGSVELYDLAKDPGETRDLSAQRPEDADRLRQQLAQWRRSVGAPMPRPNSAYDPARAQEWWDVVKRRPFDRAEEARHFEPWKYR